MATKHQKVEFKIPEDLTPSQRRDLADLIVERIVARTQLENVDKRGKPFPKYSPEYVKSLDFKLGGKTAGEVNLTLSGDMLAALKPLKIRPDAIVVGFEKGSEENGKADGNIRGTYGKPKPIGPKRDFLGLKPEELRKLIAEVKRD